MALRIVRLGTPRMPGEGLRLGTVRRPPRGVPKERFASDDWYDVWFPTLAPSPDTVALLRNAGDATERAAGFRHYRREMAAPDAAHALDLLAALSHATELSVGCYCEDEAGCHRSQLRELLRERGAAIAG